MVQSFLVKLRESMRVKWRGRNQRVLPLNIFCCVLHQTRNPPPPPLILMFAAPLYSCSQLSSPAFPRTPSPLCVFASCLWVGQNHLYSASHLSPGAGKLQSWFTTGFLGLRVQFGRWSSQNSVICSAEVMVSCKCILYMSARLLLSDDFSSSYRDPSGRLPSHPLRLHADSQVAAGFTQTISFLWKTSDRFHYYIKQERAAAWQILQHSTHRIWG